MLLLYYLEGEMAMRKKSTDELLNLIAKEGNISKFLDENSSEFENTTLDQELSRLLCKSQKSKAEIIRLTNLDKTYVYQIFDGSKPRPSRNKLLAICLAMGVDLHETQLVLRLGHSEQLHPRSIRDSVIIYAINHRTSVLNLNQILYDMEHEILS